MDDARAVVFFRWALSDERAEERVPSRRQLEAEGWRFAAAHPLYPASYLMFREEIPSDADERADNESIRR